jgi:hypothetical protein
MELVFIGVIKINGVMAMEWVMELGTPSATPR